MTKKGGFIITAVLTVLMIAILLLAYFYIYPIGIEKSYTLTPKEKMVVPILASEVQQFYPNMRFNHNNITYSFHISCNNQKRAKVHEAFNFLEERVAPLTFRESLTQGDIIIVCDEKEVKTGENTFLSGEGGPTKLYNLSLYPLIEEGQVLLYGQKLECNNPIVEIHEIMHVFGYEHVNNSHSIMNPYLNDCDQELDEAFTDHLTALYSIVPKAELYSNSLEANISGRYLNFEIAITNQGLIEAKKSTLDVLTDGKYLKSFDLENLEPGITRTLTIENLRLPRSVSEISFLIKAETPEFDTSNNLEIFPLE